MPKSFFAPRCRGTRGRNVQWPLTIFMVHEIFIVATLGKQSSPPGSVHMCKRKLNFEVPCPNSAVSRVATLLSVYLLMGRTWQETEVIAPWCHRGFLDATMGLLTSKCQKRLYSLANDHFYANVLWSISLWNILGEYFFAFSHSGTEWAVHCARDAVLFPALTVAQNTWLEAIHFTYC